MLTKDEKAHLVIHPCAVGAMCWSGVWGTVPVLGITADTPGLLAICGTMGGLLAQVHGRRFGEIKWNAAAVAAMQYFAGALAIKWLSSAIPVLGTAVNATVSLATVEATGWAFHLILNDGRDPADLSKRELKGYFRRGKMRQESGADGWPGAEKMTGPEREKFQELSRELTSPKTTERRRAEILIEIQELLAPYRPDEDG